MKDSCVTRYEINYVRLVFWFWIRTECEDKTLKTLGNQSPAIRRDTKKRTEMFDEIDKDEMIHFKWIIIVIVTMQKSRICNVGWRVDDWMYDLMMTMIMMLMVCTHMWAISKYLLCFESFLDCFLFFSLLCVSTLWIYTVCRMIDDMIQRKTEPISE